MSSVNTYELEREARIAQNKRRLAELVGGCALPVIEQPKAKKESKLQAAVAHLPPRDRSSRLAGKPAPVYVLPDDEPDHDSLTGRRRTSSRGIGGERGVYGAEGARTCHSCRQKTTSFKAMCTACPLMWCTACLRTRYNESAHSANETGTWMCPKCRSCCICSSCLKRTGRQPTGVLAPAALDAGYTSVFEMLRTTGRI